MVDYSPTSKPHEYAINFPERSVDFAAEERATKKPKPSFQPMPGQTLKSIGRGLKSIFNSPELIEKGSPETEYKFSGGWTTINNPLVKPTPYSYLDLEDDGYDGESEGSITDIDGKIHEDSISENDDEIEEDAMIDNDGEIHTAGEAALSLKTAITGPGLGSIDGLDLSSVLKKDKTRFSDAQDAEMSLFILHNKTCQVGQLKPEFDTLLSILGFLNRKLQPVLITTLRTKVRVRMTSLKDTMVKTGVAREDDSKVHLYFALWTENWKQSGWNGDITSPKSVVQKAFESGFN